MIVIVGEFSRPVSGRAAAILGAGNEHEYDPVAVISRRAAEPVNTLPAPAVVYKIGGSLLSLPDLPQRLQSLFARENGKALLVVGGGPTADLVREWDRQFELGECRAHWLALKAMALNEALLAELLPDTPIVHRPCEAESAWRNGQTAILCAHSFLVADAQEPGAHLPHGWDVTSDSIAAWIALRWAATELILVKSVPLDASNRTDSPAVDRYFRRLAPRLPRIGWVNLRSDDPRVEFLPASVFADAGTANCSTA